MTTPRSRVTELQVEHPISKWAPRNRRRAGVFRARNSLPIAGDELLADQRLAGLLMLIACPFCYVLAGIAIAAKWLQELETTARGRSLAYLDHAPPTPR